jgi:Putative Flp pilus-assembly TadE/G-like
MGIKARHHQGQIAVVLALTLPVLLGSMALCADVGVFYFNWLQLQKAADAAVLAGANYLPLDPAGAVTTANNYASLNGVAASEIESTTVAADDMSMSINLARSVPAYFARILGLVAGPVAARATAALRGVSTVRNGLVPVGIDSRTIYTVGQAVTLMEGQAGPGNWGPVALGQGGAQTFAYNVQNGYDGAVSIGDWLTTQTGIMAGPTQAAFDARMTEGQDEYPSGTFADHSLNDPRVLTVPMVNFANVNGNSQVPVVSFAELWLVSVDSNNDITTYFIGQVASGDPGATGTPTCGAYVPVLVQ